MKIKTFSKLLILALIFYPNLSFGDDKIHYGVFIQNDNGMMYGVPMLKGVGKAQNNIQNAQQQDREILINQFLKLVKTEIANFSLGKNYPAYDANSSLVNVTILTKNEPEGGEADMLFESKSQKLQKLPILFWSSKTLKPIIIKTTERTLDDSKINFFQNKAKSLIDQASSGLLDPYKFSKILKPSILSLEGNEDIITIFFPLILTKEVSNNKIHEDKRGSVFFIYDTKQDQIILGKFGHPGWSPEAKNVNVIKPVFFFSVNNESYCFCQYDSAWEHAGFALIELKSGKVSMSSY
jgi:hypothetical protein